MASCLLVTAFFCLLLGFLASGVSFLAPFWVTEDPLAIGDFEYKGLWGNCKRTHDTTSTSGINFNFQCQWFHENDFALERDLKDWHKAAQALFAFGIVTLFAVLIVASLHLCCRCCQASLSLKGALGGLLIFGGFLIAAAVAVFGGMSYKDNQTTIDSNTSRFEWGFYLGIPGAVLPILAGLFYVIESKRYEGYERGVRNDVV